MPWYAAGMREHPLRKWRMEREISGRSLAARVGISERMIRYIESGKGCGIDTALRLAKYTRLPIRSFSSEQWQ